MNDANFEAVVFDLDGTLLNTLADIAHASNLALADLGMPTHGLNDYRRFIGEGISTLFQRALGSESANEPLVEQCVLRFREHYARAWNVNTQPYEGVAELLDRLVERETPLGLLSNKPHEFTRKCVDFYLGRWPFGVVLGQREGVPRKPDPTAALEIARTLGATAERCVYVGDTATDMQTAKRSGMYPVGVAWGFRPTSELWEHGAAVVIERPIQLLDVLDGSRGEGA